MSRSQWDESKQKLVPGGVTRTDHDHLPLPGGKTIANLSNGELANVLLAAGVPNVSHSAPRTQNLQEYSRFIGQIMGDAGWRALNEWIKAKS